VNWEELLSQLQVGDIGAVKGTGLVACLQKRLLLPETDRIHHLLLGDYIREESDFVILESISKGTAVGRLVYYKDQDIEFYRVNNDDSKKLGKKAAIQATKWGRAKYDYRVILWIIWNTLKLVIKHKFGKIHITEFPPLPDDKRLLCTELVKEGYKEIFPILPPKLPAFPSAYKLSLAMGRLNLVGHWQGGA